MDNVQTAPDQQAPAQPAQPAPRARPATLWQKGKSANPAGRKPGSTNKVTATIKEAIERACAPGACHPEGLAGWLVERAQGGVQDRAIFAGLVAKALPAQLQASVQHGGVVVQLGWLQHRGVGARVTPTSHADAEDAQVIDSQGLLAHDLRVENPEGALPTPHPPQNPAAGGAAK